MNRAVQLQLIAESVELRGAGALELAFKQLKARLRAEGLFAEERKRRCRPFPSASAWSRRRMERW